MIDTEYKFGEVHILANQIESGEDKVHFKNIFSNGNGGVSIVAFKAGQALDTHTAPAEVMVTVLEGEIEFTMIDKPHHLKAGEFMLMGENVPHSVKALKDSKVMLTKIKA
ncbi:MAG: cupin domain-containing protein [Muribaculaceae bacterium]|nr:cupin domain-containing protein [Muribaculaceae bacterium]